MAKITVLGSAFVLTSNIKMEDLKLVEKYYPEALKLVEEETKNEYFAIGCGSLAAISEKGISFNETSDDGQGYACLTRTFSKEEGVDVKVQINDMIGSILCNLRELERLLPDVVEKLQTEQQRNLECIEVAGTQEEAVEADAAVAVQ